MEVRDAASAVYRVEPEAARADDDVPLGYKRTEVGVIPRDWSVTSLNTVTDCLDNLRVPLNESQRDQRRGDIPYCGANGVLDFIDGYVIDDDIILMAEDGGYFDEYHTRPIAYQMRGKCWVNNHAHILKAKDAYSQGFVFYSLVHKNILSYLASGTRAKLNRAEMDKIEIPLPPAPAEQQAIAEALSDADTLIELLQQLIAKQRALKQGAMQALLTGRQRLPGFTGEWQTTQLGTALQFQVGCPFSSTYFNETGEGLRLVRNRDLKADDQMIHYSGPYDASFIVKDGDVLIGMDGDFVACRWRKGPALLNQRVGRVVPKPTLDNVFAFYCLADPLRMIEDQTSSTTVKHLSHSEVEGIEMRMPAIEEQTAIAAVLSDMYAEIEALEARLAKTRALKAGMMQMLLTGKIRLV